MKRSKRWLVWFCMLWCGGVAHGLAATNDWTKATSGYWEEPYWSLGQLPGTNQEWVALNNPGWKALAIGANTTANFPDSLIVNNLIIDAPANSANQLLLNWAGLTVPLVIRSNLIVGTNGSIASHYSAIQAGIAEISGAAAFLDYAIEDFEQLSLQSDATVGLTNGSMTCSNLLFRQATFTQSGGTHIVQEFIIPSAPNSWSDPFYWGATYYLWGGWLISGDLQVGSGGNYYPEGFGLIQQTRGIHTNAAMLLLGWGHYGNHIALGSYTLDGGLLVSSSVGIFGLFTQNGGTNRIQELSVGDGGQFCLNEGELVTSNVVVSGDSYTHGLGYHQTGGVHTVEYRLLIEPGWPGDPVAYPTYEIAAGSMITASIEIRGGLRISSEGAVSNTGVLALAGGAVVQNDGLATQHLGQLQAWGHDYSFGGSLYLHDRYSPTNKPTIWHFADSHNVTWTNSDTVIGPLIGINQWSSGDHIYFGTNDHALTTAQLAKIAFFVSNTNYLPAMLLSTGELVPAVPPPLAYTNARNALVLSWPSGYELVSATNVIGPYNLMPGSTSPWTNHFVEPQRYFRLRLPTP